MKTKQIVSYVLTALVGMVLAALLIVFIFGLTPSQITSRRNNQAIFNILNNYHRVTHIALVYDNDTFWFYGENLEAVKTKGAVLLSP
jgi:G:T/U-mismatch repair DNA glycosylase